MGDHLGIANTRLTVGICRHTAKPHR